MTDQPTSPTEPPLAIPPALAAFIASADPATVPPPVTTTGPADDVAVDQDPDFEESDVADDAADTSLADPAVQEV